MLNKNYFIIEFQRVRALVIVNIFVDCFGLFCLLLLGQCLILNCFCFSIFLSSFFLFSFFLSFDPCFRFAFSICFSFLILSNSARSSVFFFAYSIAFSFLIFSNTDFPSWFCFLSFFKLNPNPRRNQSCEHCRESGNFPNCVHWHVFYFMCLRRVNSFYATFQSSVMLCITIQRDVM